MDRDHEDPMELDTEHLPIGKSLTTRESSEKPKVKPAPQTTLRTLQRSERHFWQDSHSAQMSLVVVDKKPDGNARRLPGNEIATMALNEIAALRGRRGFFFHLKSRDGWNKSPGEALYPATRVPPQPGAQFPNLVYMKYSWTDSSRANFLNTSHRSRYLTCDGLINPPLGHTPLYAIQYVSSPNYPVYITSAESLIVLATPSTFYLATSSQLKEVVGLWPKKKRPPTGPDTHMRLNTTPYLFKEMSSEQAKKNGVTELYNEMRQFEVPDIEALYDAIVAWCKPEKIMATFTARGLQETIPRPSTPEPGVALGTPLSPIYSTNEETVNESSNPPSRRGGRLQRGRMKPERGSSTSGGGARGNSRK